MKFGSWRKEIGNEILLCGMYCCHVVLVGIETCPICNLGLELELEIKFRSNRRFVIIQITFFMSAFELISLI